MEGERHHCPVLSLLSDPPSSVLSLSHTHPLTYVKPSHTRSQSHTQSTLIHTHTHTRTFSKCDSQVEWSGGDSWPGMERFG